MFRDLAQSVMLSKTNEADNASCIARIESEETRFRIALAFAVHSLRACRKDRQATVA